MLHDRIVSALREWMAAQQSPGRDQATAQRAIPLHSFHCIFRTCRNVAAGGREHGRDGPFVASQQKHYGALWKISHLTIGARSPFFRLRQKDPAICAASSE